MQAVESILNNLQQLGCRHPSLITRNHFVLYDTMINAIHSYVGILTAEMMETLLQRKFPEHHWLSWEDILDCINEWPSKFGKEVQHHPVLFSDYSMYQIAKGFFWAFHEWKTPWSEIDC